jgi:hypothetical protein
LILWWQAYSTISRLAPAVSYLLRAPNGYLKSHIFLAAGFWGFKEQVPSQCQIKYQKFNAEGRLSVDLPYDSC